MPQGSPLSPLLSNILLDVLDKHIKIKDLKFVRYADDFCIYMRSKAEAQKIGNEVYLFLKNKLDLPINREKSGVRRPTKFGLLGHGFAATYGKREKGDYQLIVKKESWNNLKRKLKNITRRPCHTVLRYGSANSEKCGWAG